MDEAKAVPESATALSDIAALPKRSPAARTQEPAFRDALLIAIGWMGTALSLHVTNLPFKFVLKEELGLPSDVASAFFVFANIPIYVKPFAGILSDAVPLWGTRRKSYLILSLLLAGALWLALALVPRTYAMLLGTYVVLNIFLTLSSTVLGGLMVEVGKRDRNTGALSAQRHGINQVVRLISDPAGGVLSRLPFLVTGAIAAGLQWILVPFYLLLLKEPQQPQASARETLAEVRRQFRGLIGSKTLWAAAGLVVLVIAAPGFNMALLYYQQDVLKFDKEFIGVLGMLQGLGGMVGAVIYAFFCRRWNLRRMMYASIVFHGLMTLLYLGYKTPASAMIITPLEGATLVLAVLPLYDLSARATPRGSEALGYCLMMSVWNFTQSLSDWLGSVIYQVFHTDFSYLVWTNCITTTLVIFAVPFLPSVLMDRRDGDPERGLSVH